MTRQAGRARLVEKQIALLERKGVRMKGRSGLIVLLVAAGVVGAVLALRPRRPRVAGMGAYVGNPDSMVLHRMECRQYEASDDAPVFADREEAIAMGFRPCGICQP